MKKTNDPDWGMYELQGRRNEFKSSGSNLAKSTTPTGPALKNLIVPLRFSKIQVLIKCPYLVAKAVDQFHLFKFPKT